MNWTNLKVVKYLEEESTDSRKYYKCEYLGGQFSIPFYRNELRDFNNLVNVKSVLMKKVMNDNSFKNRLIREIGNSLRKYNA